jgi:hypothetical protein
VEKELADGVGDKDDKGNGEERCGALLKAVL